MPENIELVFGPFEGGFVNERVPHLLRADEAQVAMRVDATNGSIRGNYAKTQATGSPGTAHQWFAKTASGFVTKTARQWHVYDGGQIYVVPEAGGAPKVISYATGTESDMGITVPALSMSVVADSALDSSPPNFSAARSKKFLPKFAITKYTTDASGATIKESNPQFFDSVTTIRKTLTVMFPGGGAWDGNNDPTDTNWWTDAETESTTLQVLPYDLENIMKLTNWYVKVTGGASDSITARVEWRPSTTDDWQLFGAGTRTGPGRIDITGSAEITTTGSQSSFGVKVTVTGGTFVGYKMKGPIYFPLLAKVAFDSLLYRVWRWSGTVYEFVNVAWPSPVDIYIDGGKYGTNVTQPSSQPSGVLTDYVIDTNRLLVWKDGGYPDLGDDTNRTVSVTYTEDHGVPPSLIMLSNALHSSVTVGRPGGGMLLAVETANLRRLRWTFAGNVHYWPAKYYVDLADEPKAAITNAGFALILTPTLTYQISGMNDAQPNLSQVPIGHHIRSDAGKSAVWTPYGTVYVSKEGLVITDGRDSRVLSAGQVSKEYWDGLTIRAAAYYRDRYELLCSDRVVSADFSRGPDKVRFFVDDTSANIATSLFLLGTLWVSDETNVYEWRATSSTRQLFKWRTGLLSNGNLLIARRIRVVSEGTITVRWVNDLGSVTSTYAKAIAVSSKTESYLRLPNTCKGRYPALEVEATSASDPGTLHKLTLYGEVYNQDSERQRA